MITRRKRRSKKKKAASNRRIFRFALFSARTFFFPLLWPFFPDSCSGKYVFHRRWHLARFQPRGDPRCFSLSTFHIFVFCFFFFVRVFSLSPIPIRISIPRAFRLPSILSLVRSSSSRFIFSRHFSIVSSFRSPPRSSHIFCAIGTRTYSQNR